MRLALPSAPGPTRRTGIYVHIPFCIVRCAYCDFNAYSGMDHLAGSYTQALLSQISAESSDIRIDTVFFGGGTPTQLRAADLGAILRAIKDSFDVAVDAEVSVEANPESVDEAKFAQLLEAGFSRVSVGVQSTSPRVLTSLGRVHSSERAIEALTQARSAGFQQVSADLIFGTSGETDDDWRRSLSDVLSTGADHISAYALTIEEGTPLDAWVRNGTVPSPDEDVQADRYEIASQLLSDAGMVRYEVSNWARPGHWCRHNLGYWRADDYLAFGAGAHGHLGGRRWWNVKSPQAYISRSPSVVEESEVLDAGQRASDAAVLGLRLAGGLHRAAFAARWGADPVALWPDLERHVEAGLLVVDDVSLRPSTGGFFLLNEVLRTVIGPPGAVSV